MKFFLQKCWSDPGARFIDGYVHPECTHLLTIEAKDFNEALEKWASFRREMGTRLEPGIGGEKPG